MGEDRGDPRSREGIRRFLNTLELLGVFDDEAGRLSDTSELRSEEG